MPNPPFPGSRLAPRLVLALLAPWAALAGEATPHALSADPDAGRPRWEAGIAAGGGHVADYPGAGQSHTRGIAVPVFIYRGPVLRIDGDGVRGRVFDHPDIHLDLAATAAFSARDNDARRGMPSLDYLVGIGPQLVYTGWRDQPGSPTLHLQWRGLISTDLKQAHGRGFTVSPAVRWRWRMPALHHATLSLSVQPTWASAPLQRYFYEVPAAHATAERPAYRARAGYLGTEFALTLSRRHSDAVTWFATLRGMSLHGAANRASPLHRSSSDVNVGAGVVWTPWQSAERVAR